jgi:SAM-dependent methyltransferase
MIVHRFPEYRASVDAFNASQSNRVLLDEIRTYNHRMMDELDSILTLRGRVVLDIGASPHGYSLERALERDVALYVGIGLDIAAVACGVGEWGNAGVLMAMDATALRFPSDVFDAVISLSTLEHVQDVEATLSEMARVLKPEGRALITFEPVWSCSYGHHLHHFGPCARLVPPWAHLTWKPERMRRHLEDSWPQHAPLSVEEAIQWIYRGKDINRYSLRDYRGFFERAPLEVEWIVDLKEVGMNADAQTVAATGFSPEELVTKGLSVLLRKGSPRCGDGGDFGPEE